MVAEVSFAEWTNEGLLRQAAFQGLRKDKAAKSVIKEGTGNTTPVRAATSATAQTSVRSHAGKTARQRSMRQPLRDWPSSPE